MSIVSRVVHTFFVACFFVLFSNTASAAFDWNSFTAPPRAIPFTQGGVTYTSFVQARHPWYNFNYIVYYPTGISDSLKPVGVDYNQGAPYQHLRVLLNPISQNQAWDSEDYNPNVLVFQCYGNQEQTACQNNAWDSWSSSQIRNMQYTWSDWNYAGPTGYDLRSDLVRAVGIDIKINFSYNWDGQFGLGYLAAGDILVHGTLLPSSYLSFPIADLTAYTAPVSAVMDHTMNGLYAADTDNRVTAFNGEVGTEGPVPGSTCRWKLDRTAFLVGIINYVGTRGTLRNRTLCYDGHPGYDYPQPLGTDILAPADGKLCVATEFTAPRSPANVWRDASICPLAAAPETTTVKWRNYRAFYILHGSMYINGSNDEYMTVFLHSNNLENSVWSTIASQGYASVTRSQHIADVGGWGPKGADHFGPHIHIEMYKKNTSGDWDRVDPYGNGVNGILWQH